MAIDAQPTLDDIETLLSAWWALQHERSTHDAFFALLDPAMDERIEKRGDKYHIDLKAINRLWLLRSGIDPSRIDVHPDCTKCHPERYWSHRAMGDQRGGMAAMICLTEDAL